MSDQFLLSIIIPMYKSFDLFQKALGIFEKKAPSSIEFVVVDDCSPDDSYTRMKKYADSSSLNIFVYKNEKNSGPGVTRNNGIEKSTGKYLMFLDSDDYLRADFFEKILPLLELNYDSVVFDYVISSSSDTVYPIFFTSMSSGLVDTGKAFAYIKGGTCCKIYRKDVVMQHNARFLPQFRNEDLPFTKTAISYCNTIYYIPEAFYYYVMNDDSLMHNSKLLDVKNAYAAYAYIEKNANKVYRDSLEIIYLIEMLSSVSLSNLEFLSRYEWRQSVSNMFSNCRGYRKNKYYDDLSVKRKLVLWAVSHKMYYFLHLCKKIGL